MKRILLTLLVLVHSICSFSQGNKKTFEKFFDGERFCEDYSKITAIDEEGNTYVAGTSNFNTDESVALIILKIAPDGSLLKKYSPITRLDKVIYPTDMKVGKNGDVWVSANFSRDSYGYTGAVVKLNKDSVQWIRTPQSGFTQVLTIDIDGQDNVYFGGSVYDEIIYQRNNTLLGKYNSNGDSVWINVDTLGTVNDADRAMKLEFKQGSVWMLGALGLSGMFGRYNSLNGKNDWLYTGTNFAYMDDDYLLRKIYIDNQLNSYYIYPINAGGQYAHTGILKIDAMGNVNWEHRYRGAGDELSNAVGSAFDSEQKHIYLYGLTHKDQVYDVAIGKVDITTPLPKLKWCTMVASSAQNKGGTAFCFDEKNSNFYAVANGYFAPYGRANYAFSMDTSGTLKWYRELPTIKDPVIFGAVRLPANEVRFAGHASIGINNSRIYILDYDTSGTFLDSTHYEFVGHGKEHTLYQHVDKFGNVHVLGESKNLAKGTFVTYKKIDPSGITLESYDVPGIVRAGQLVTDLAGNVYVTGSSVKDDHDTVVVISFNAATQTVNWKQRIGQTLYPAEAAKIKITDDGNLYVSFSEFKNFEHVISTSKIDIEGNVLWTQRFKGSSGYAKAVDIDVDADENVYIIGTAEYYPNGTTMAWLKYDSSGTRLDTTIWLGSVFQPFEIILDEDGNSYIGFENKTKYRGAIVKLDQQGEISWTKEMDECGYKNSLSDIVLDKKGNLYANGQTADCTTGNYDKLITVKFDTVGNELWKNIRDYPSKKNNLKAGSIGVDSSLNVVSCYSEGIEFEDQILGFTLVKYDSLGREIWTDSYSGSHSKASTDNKPLRELFHISENGDIIFSGESYELENGTDMFTVKYGLCNGPVAIEGPGAVCNGESAEFTASGGTAYQWSPSNYFNAPNTATSAAIFYDDTTISVKVSDGLGCYCSIFKKITVTSVTSATAFVKSPSCPGSADGEITVVNIVGTGAPYTINGQSGNILTNLIAGSYTIVVENSAGCKYQFVSTVIDPAPFYVNTTKTDDNNNQKTGTATAHTTGGKAPFTYSWDDPMNQTTMTATGLGSGTYHAIVTDANGCTSAGEVILGNTNVGINEQNSIQIFNAFRSENQLLIKVLTSAPLQGSYKVISLEGKVLIQFDDDEVSVGHKTIRIDLGNLASGIYILHWTLGDQTGAVKFVW